MKKVFNVAVEEAEEMVAVRNGENPAPNHQTLDLRLEVPMYDVEYGAETGVQL